MDWFTSLMQKITSFFILIFIAVEGLVSPVFAAGNPVNISSQSGVSRNWAGFSATGGDYTGVSGSWIIPISPANDPGVDATWVGIGGVDSHDLIQAGTQRIGNNDVGSVYEAFFELLPGASRPLAIAVNGGDSVSVSINEQRSNQWQISFTDNTTGKNIQTTVNYSSSLTSSEWIMEAPSTGRRILPLDNFGSVQFTSATTIKNGKMINLNQANAQEITMIDNSGIALATPSGIYGDGGSFTVTRNDNNLASDEMNSDSFFPIGFGLRFGHHHYRRWLF